MSGPAFVLMGIGNAGLADDGAGVFVSRLLKHPSWLSLDCGTSPEAFTSTIRSSGAGTAVLVDAVRMGLVPGELRRIPLERVADTSIGSHDMPLSRLMEYLSISVGVSSTLIGIQPDRVEPGEVLSPEVEKAARRLAAMLADGSWVKIPVLKEAL